MRNGWGETGGMAPLRVVGVGTSRLPEEVAGSWGDIGGHVVWGGRWGRYEDGCRAMQYRPSTLCFLLDAAARTLTRLACSHLQEFDIRFDEGCPDHHIQLIASSPFLS